MKKFENFSSALDNLKLCRNYSAPYDVVTETGLVNLFSICFEQAWKASGLSSDLNDYFETGDAVFVAIKLE